MAHLHKTNFWLHLTHYEIASIVQGDSYANFFKEFNNILDIIWWRYLRVGNWKRFMNTLEYYAYNNSYQLYTGTSGAVKFPIEGNCAQNNVLEIPVNMLQLILKYALTIPF